MERADFTFEAGGLGPGDWSVVRFRGSEGVSTLFRFDIELASPDPAIDLDAVVGQAGTLTIVTGAGPRHVHGIVSRIEVASAGRATTRYAARLVPRLWTLGLRRQSRIYQDRATPKILSEALEGAGIPANGYSLRLKRSYSPRRYCVQYRETDLDFIRRLMEEEGIVFFFEHDGKGHVLVIADHNEKFPAIEGEATVAYVEGETGLFGEDEVTDLRLARGPRPGAYAHRDHDFRKPALALEAKKAAGIEEAFEVYEFPAAVPDVGIAEEIARVRLEAERADRVVGAGEGNCRRFAAGARFTLEGHPDGSIDGEYLLAQVHHWGSQQQAAGADVAVGQALVPYRNAFECLPADVPVRPRRATPLPRVEGPQTAIVTGPPGEEIHVDEYGRVKIRFLWDRRDPTDATSSCWVRVAQPSGAPGWGSVFLPRIGTEVVVDFLEGDPNRPIVVGRLYNGENPPPYALPSEKTVSGIKTITSPGGGGFNELRMDDTAGAQLVNVHAQKDMNVAVANNKTQRVGGSERITVGASRSRTVGGSETIQIGGNRDTSVYGRTELEVGGSQTISIGGMQSNVWVLGKEETVTGNVDETVGGARISTVVGSYSESIDGSAQETVGAVKLAMVKGSLSRNVGAVDIVTTGARVLKATGSLIATCAGRIAYAIGGIFNVKAGGDFTVSGKTVTVQAGVIKLKGGGSNTDLLGGPVKIKGSEFDVDASKVAVKGSTVKVN